MRVIKREGYTPLSERHENLMSKLGRKRKTEFFFNCCWKTIGEQFGEISLFAIQWVWKRGDIFNVLKIKIIGFELTIHFIR